LETLLWAAGLFAVTFTVSLLLFGVLVVVLPERYFLHESNEYWREKPPVIRWLGIIGKNLLGVVLIGLGLLLSLPGIPGQGLLTVLIGVMLLDLPGKRRLARWVFRQPRMLRGVNRVRAWFRRPPLVVD
jgi:hypothetical protein